MPSTELLSIGELARRSGLTPKALRLYDEAGLLVPDRVDPFTGYRSYHPEQVSRARRIAALRGIGMGLARIRTVCDLAPQGAAQELRSWWSQEQADALSRSAAVAELIAALEESPSEDTMTTIDPTTARPAPRTSAHALARRLRRPQLQDAAMSTPMPGGRHLLAVADGFADAGSAPEALAALARALESALGRGDQAIAALRAAWEDASAAALGTGGGPGEEAAHEGGTTLTAALVDGGTLVIAHIGDTRALLVREGTLFPITQDHTLVASLVAAGRLRADEAAAHPQRAVLNRALAAGAPREPDLLLRELRSGDRVVLTSDGVHAVLAPELLAEIVCDVSAGAEHTALALLRAAEEAEGEDDVAAAVADLR
ncbi:serine/threonine protein phosphatase [Brachybacterium phenoliresistens]|uniref:Serine/threonine protein phosphatase n=1 Tax=Brachybacterium phenoliresistens TaxID=396014 RepID=Z9JSU8_9MICO|nr:MerR family transcriptional regulator [Brachybacterium phenoliresistens]EWS81279.1 serine/threonine protein phosphatase [Brachybacterium phenoliresistens]